MMLQPEVEQESIECESTGDKNNETYCFRLLYTDSGHYLLPIDDPQAQIEEEPHLALIAARHL